VGLYPEQYEADKRAVHETKVVAQPDVSSGISLRAANQILDSDVVVRNQGTH